MSEDTPKSKRKRTPFEERERQILCQIIKEVDGGKAWKIIKEGTGTNAQKCVAWEKVKDLFNEATGKSCDRKQIQELFDRIKDKKKCWKRKERCEILKEKAAHKHLQQDWGTVLNGMCDDNFESQDEEEDSSDESLNNNS